MLEAIASTFYDVLADNSFGYADVTIVQLLAHITTEYDTLTGTDLELNRNRLKEAWHPDDEFTNLWTHIKTLRQIALDGGDAISDNTTMELTLVAFRQASVYTPIRHAKRPPGPNTEEPTLHEEARHYRNSHYAAHRTKTARS
jgi:hypothetical protein